MKMENPFTINIRAVRRVVCLMLAVLMVVGVSPIIFRPGQAFAATQLTSRSIQLSDSAPSGGSIVSGIGSGTSVSYQVTFTNTSEASSLVIDFCSNDPIIGDSCTAPTGLNAGSAVLNATAYAPTSGGAVQTTTDNWSVTASASQIKLANDNAGGGSGGTHPTHDIQAATTQSFQLTGITNPSTTGTYYARIYTYADNDWCTTGGVSCYTGPASANLGTYEDFGGIALSTVAVIEITARVQESLTFCVTAADPNTWTGAANVQGTCASAAVAAAPPTITIGHSIGGGTPVIDPTAVDTTPVYSQLSTNATHGAIINLRNANSTCTYTGSGSFPGGGLSADGGATCSVPPVNDGAAGTASAITHGTAAFGLDVCSYTTGSTPALTTNLPAIQSGSLDPTNSYNSNFVTGTGLGGACPGTNYGMDTHTQTGAAPYPGVNGNVSSTYGSNIANSTSSVLTPGPVYAADDIDTFGATAGLTTPAGIYTANLVMIATGTF
jgi:hypothetical protein